MLWEWMPEILQRHGHQSPEHSSVRRGDRDGQRWVGRGMRKRGGRKEEEEEGGGIRKERAGQNVYEGKLI